MLVIGGLLLVLLRVSVVESGMFRDMAAGTVRRGNFLALFTSRDRFGRFAHSILIG